MSEGFVHVCGVCGSNAKVQLQRVGKYRRTGTKYQVVCVKPGCNVRGPRATTVFEAANRWNQMMQAVCA